MASKTKTASFGVSQRVNHDSSLFYARKLYKNQRRENVVVPYVENPVPEEYKDRYIVRDSQDLSFLPDCSIHLTVCSPPYNVGKEYDDDLSLEEYLQMLKNVMMEVYRVTVPGGRVCINVANLGRKPYIPLHSMIVSLMTEIGFLNRGEIIWNKGASSGQSLAWGSFQSASGPSLRDVHEYISVWCKENFTRPQGDRENDITREEFMEYTKSIWTFPAVSARKIGHPAPFPVELPRRCIKLFSFKGDVVLDPFAGSGTTGVAAIETGRHFVCVDIKEEYKRLGDRYLGEAKLKANRLSLF